MKQQFVIERGQSPWQGYTDSAAMEQANKSISSLAITQAMERFSSLSGYELDGKPFLAVDRQARRVVVNRDFFSPLSRVDATRAQQAEKQAIGRVMDTRIIAAAEMLFAFLIESQIIQTYWHIGATLDLVEMKEDGNLSFASWTGEHAFFTDRKNVDKLSFIILLDHTTGDVWIEGR
jgi:hypothetical protein